MLGELKWQYYEAKRLWRLWVEPEQSMRLAVKVIGVWWLWRRHIRREFKVYPWRNRHEFYALDLANADTYRAVEIDGSIHQFTKQRDILRDHRLAEKGWEIMRVSEDELIFQPAKTRRRVRRFLG